MIPSRNSRARARTRERKVARRTKGMKAEKVETIS